MWFETLGDYKYRPPYLPQFFGDVARAIPLSGSEALLDLGCGPGDVAFGFAPYVGNLTGVDAELPLLEAARERARELGVDIRLVHSRVQEAPEDLGRFHLITIGQAHWFMHSPATLARLDHWLLPGGCVLICRPLSRAIGGATWLNEYSAIRRRWSRGDVLERMCLTVEEFFAGSNFMQAGMIEALGERRVEFEHLARRALGVPDTSRAMLGADAEKMIAEIRARMAPHFKNGPLTEQLGTVGVLYRRRGDH
ncbi:MAG: class I SAM-dependent methyltransferase [Acidobacteriota bacterium]